MLRAKPTEGRADGLMTERTGLITAWVHMYHVYSCCNQFCPLRHPYHVKKIRAPNNRPISSSLKLNNQTNGIKLIYTQNWAWPGNATITDHEPTIGTCKKKDTEHQRPHDSRKIIKVSSQLSFPRQNGCKTMRDIKNCITKDGLNTKHPTITNNESTDPSR